MHSELENDLELRLKEVEPLVTAILCKNMRVRMRPIWSGGSFHSLLAYVDNRDGSKEYQDALELRSEVLATLLERLKGSDSLHKNAILKLDDYAASVTYNTFYEYLRREYPLYFSLENRLRYFLEHQRGYAVWKWNDELYCGLAEQKGRGPNPELFSQIASLKAGFHSALPDVTFKLVQDMKRKDWQAALPPLFKYVKGAIRFNDLVSLLAPLTGARVTMENEDPPDRYEHE